MIRQALEVQDTKILEQLTRHSATASEGFRVASRRLVDRFKSSIALSNPETAAKMTAQQREHLEQIAQEPNMGDATAFHRMNMDLFRMAIAMSTPPDQPLQKAGVQVNVNQGQTQQASSMSSVEDTDIDAVYEHIEALQKATPEEQARMSKYVEGLGMREEATED